MHARVTTLEVPPDRMDDATRHVQEQVLPQLSRMEGFQGFIALGSRLSGKLQGASFWESEQALRATNEAMVPVRQGAAEAAGGTVAGVEEFEVQVFEAPSAGPISGVTGGTTRQAAQTAQEGVSTTGQTVGGLLGAATGAVTDVTAGAAGAAAEGTERAVEAVAFPIEGYDEMNVDEISKRLKDLSVEELQLVRDYEELNKRRESLLEQMDRKIRSA